MNEEKYSRIAQRFEKLKDKVIDIDISKDIKFEHGLYLGESNHTIVEDDLGFEDVIYMNPETFNFDNPIFPLKDNYYDYVRIRSVIGLVNNPSKFLLKIRKACKSNAIIEISCAYYSNKCSVSNIDFLRSFSEISFIWFVAEYHREFKIDKIVLVPTLLGKFIIFKWLRRKLSLLINGLYGSMNVKLEVKK